MSALVVEPEAAERTLLVSTLRAVGMTVTAVDDYASARAALLHRAPSVLIAEIRLGKHNGLHLVDLGRWLRPRMIPVVTSSYCDPVLTHDAEEMGAIFVQKPFTTSRLIALLRDIRGVLDLSCGGMEKPLRQRVAVVAGATRGAGRGIARMLGEAGATVYCTGRSSRSQPNLSDHVNAGRPETIEETAELVSADGGTGIPVHVRSHQ